MINLLSAVFSVLAGVSDFFNNKVELGSMAFKIWQLIVIGVATVVAIILIICLIVDSAKLKKAKALKEEAEKKNDDDTSSIEDEVASDVIEEASEDQNAEDTSPAVEENAEEVAPIEEENAKEVAPVVEESAPAKDTQNENVVDSNEEQVEEQVEDPAPVINAQNESVLDKEQNVAEQVKDTEVAREDNSAEEVANSANESEDNPTPSAENEDNASENIESVEEVEQPVDVANNEEKSKVNNLDNTQKENEQMSAEEKDNVINMEPQEEQERGVLGKYTIQLSLQGYCFTLSANNGQILYESFGYTTVEGASAGIDTFKKSVASGKFYVSGDKYGRYRFILNKRYQGPNYPSKLACEKAIKSVERFANNSRIAIVDPTEEEIQQYNEFVQESKKPKGLNWDELNKEFAKLPRLGSFEISVNEDGAYQFFLVANNKQVLYTSVLYASLTTVKNAIENFRRAVCLGTFFVEMDKYKRYRFILRVANAVTYIGESYPSKASALNSIESVKNFVKTARIVLPKNGDEGEDVEGE